MKKVLSLILAVMLIVSAFSITASAADYTNYIYVKNSDRTVEQAQISTFIDGSLLTPGELYTVTVVFQAQKVMPFGGHAFVSCYSYKQYTPESFDGLGAWKDFAVVGSGTQRWTEVSYEYYADEPTDKVLLSLGFYKAMGTIAVAELTFKGPDGTIIYEADFSKGLDENEWVVTQAKEGVVFEYGVEGATEAPTVEPTAEPTPAPVAPTLNGEPSAWAKEEILKALEADLVPSHVNSAYTTDITRSDFCDLIIKMIEKKSGKAIADVIAGYADAKADVSFPDTDSANVIAAAKLGIVNGRSSGAFDPTANITRQEAAKMLALAAKVLGADITASAVDFADADTIYDWAKEFIYYVNTIGVMNGTSTTTPPNFSPLRTYTREQSILTVYRLFNAMTTAVADAYAGNLLEYTEENISAIWDSSPWEANSEEKFYTWGQPGTTKPSDWKTINNGETSAAFSFTTDDEATIADKNKEAGKTARSIKVDLSKLNIEANLPHIQGNFLDVYTDSCEAGKDYTFFFKVKLSEDATDNSIVLGSFNESSLTDLKADPQYVYTNIDDTTHVLANVVATKEWQLVKYTFTMKSTLVGPLTGIVINVGKQAETSGYLYIDGIALVEGDLSDADAFYMN